MTKTLLPAFVFGQKMHTLPFSLQSDDLLKGVKSRHMGRELIPPLVGRHAITKTL